MRSRRFLAGAAAVAIVAAAAAGSAAAGGGSHWQQRLAADLARYPAVAPAALAQVEGQPPFLELVFVSGAIGGHDYPPACTLASSDATGFARAAQARLLARPGLAAYVQGQGWSAQSLGELYLRGVLFGCAH